MSHQSPDMGPHHQTVDRKSILVRCSHVIPPIHTWPVPELTSVRHRPSDSRCWANQSHQHKLTPKQSQGPPSCPNSQLTYWQPKGLSVPPITPALCLGRT